MAKRSRPSNPEEGTLRIIGGEWRGRKLRFPAVPGLRPSPDRVRETLFNWLQTDIAGARCLDLFTGSGALGLEALSRGARHCMFVDAEATAVHRIDEHLRVLHCERGDSALANARSWLERTSAAAFDVVFLDPPFRRGLLEDCCTALEHGWLADDAWIYMESGRDEPLPAVPPTWTLHRDKAAGQVAYRLWHRQTASVALSGQPHLG